MKLIDEFKEFAVKGNMMDMAVGIIIGASFNTVINVLVKQILMPPLSLLTDGINFQNKKIVLQPLEKSADGIVLAEEAAIGYGALAEATVDFMIIGFTVFIIIKFMNRLRSKAQDSKDKTVATPKDIELLTEISELMAKQNELLKQQKA